MHEGTKPDYKNWVPCGLIWALGSGTALCLILLFTLISTDFAGSFPALRSALSAALALLFAVLLFFTCWMSWLHASFDFNGKKQTARRIIEGVAQYVTLPDGGLGLDVGCGSGALTIACAKRNPHAKMLGIDCWGKDYQSFSQALCEQNARAEGAAAVSFCKGDAVRLDFADGSFDAVTSNYVYHNIHGRKKQDLLRETLRVLKKGGVFALHDIMSKGTFGDMEDFARQLQKEGCEQVELIRTTQGLFLSKNEAWKLGLKDSVLLFGRK